MIATERLLLRPWWDDDFARMAEIHADPQTMATLGGTLDRAASDAWIARQIVHWGRHGFGFWAVEAAGRVSPLIGAVGLFRLQSEMPPAPAVEIGWRLGSTWWGRGYATEAAKAALQDGFDRCGLHAIVAITATTNTRSLAVMHRLGMTPDAAASFDHPRLPIGSPLRPHLLYRFTAAGAPALPISEKP